MHTLIYLKSYVNLIQIAEGRKYSDANAIKRRLFYVVNYVILTHRRTAPLMVEGLEVQYHLTSSLF